ncbi:hypothetical protein [Sulfuriferula sp. AH1]|uniref:hypothetical protein n=1 Tax=Sulfuriferula sp. AH1 TaxID=1985873 RepID=UPI0012FCF3D8|nr:hypothetical protein [Sulfuriferula sp. AH1]
MPLREHEWALNRVLLDWKARSIRKPRANLPVEFTSSTLRYIRQRACHTADGANNCEVWTNGERYVAFDDVPCQRCKQPGISNFQFSAALFGQDESDTKATLSKLDKDVLLNKKKRVIRRFINSEAPMQSDDFKRAVANALVHRWISDRQAYSILMNTLELESASSWLRRFMKRFRERMTFKQTGIIADDPAMVASQLDAELRNTQVAFLEKGRQRIAGAQNMDAEDKQWLLDFCHTGATLKSKRPAN